MNIRYFTRAGKVWLDIRGPGVPGGRKRVSSGKSTEAEAREATADILRSVLAQPAPPAGTGPDRQRYDGPTLRDAFAAATRTREAWITAKSRGTLEHTYKGIGLPDDTPLASLTRDRVRELRGRWLQEPGKRDGTTLSASTINHRLSMLSVLLEAADLPPHGVKHLSTRGNRRKRRVSDEEITRAADWCAANADRRGALELADLILLGIDTAARLGELLGLRARHVDISEGLVVFEDTKNSETRVVPLRERAARILARRVESAQAGRLWAVDQDRVEKLWGQMRAALGLAGDPEFVFHALRHEALSRLADEERNAFTIQHIAGHSSIATTQVYVKSSLGAMRAAMGVKHGDTPASATDADAQHRT